MFDVGSESLGSASSRGARPRAGWLMPSEKRGRSITGFIAAQAFELRRKCGSIFKICRAPAINARALTVDGNLQKTCQEFLGANPERIMEPFARSAPAVISTYLPCYKRGNTLQTPVY